MANVLIAIATLIIGFTLALYGTYTNVEAGRRTQYATSINSTLEREAKYIQDVAQDLGRMPLSGDYDSVGVFGRDSNSKFDFFYTAQAEGYFVCARTSDSSQTMREALQIVSRDRPGSFVSGACGVSATPISTYAAVSMKVN